jgi:hypothetical protein
LTAAFHSQASVRGSWPDAVASDEFQQSLGIRRPLSLCDPTSTLGVISAVEAAIAL